ncbi:MAG: endonuclease III domain-containing protein [Tepidiformaceae bacterium]
MHAWRGWHWWPDAEPFEVIVGGILVQNTAWTNVERALDRLRAADALEPGRMAALTDNELEELVRPSGQHRQKAKKLRAMLELVMAAGSLRALLETPGPELRARLLATWGIGEETADAIVLYASHQPSFVVDAYTQRIFGRLGLGPGSGRYGDWQRYFVERLEEDRDLWARFHALIVLHAKHLCRKRAPLCGQCSLAPRCGFPGDASTG